MDSSYFESSLEVFETTNSRETTTSGIVGAELSPESLICFSLDSSCNGDDSLIVFSEDDSDSEYSEPLQLCELYPLHSTPKKPRLSSLIELEDSPIDSSPTVANPLNCCSDQCLHFISLAESHKVREVFQSKSHQDQQQFLLDSALMFTSHSDCLSSTPKKQNKWMLEGKQVCEKAFCRIVGISQKRLRKSLAQYHSGITKAIRKIPNRSTSTKGTEAKTWMKNYFHLVGDKMPHLQKTHLPHFLTKKDVYARMKTELIDQGIQEDQIISLKTFYRLWKNDFRDVLIPEVRETQILKGCISYSVIAFLAAHKPRNDYPLGYYLRIRYFAASFSPGFHAGRPYIYLYSYSRLATYCFISQSSTPYLLLPVQQSRFSKCDICTKFDQERSQSGGRCGFTEEYSRHLRIVE